MSQCVCCKKDAEKEYRFVVVASVISSQTKEYIVATFLAILEMARSKEIMITQKENFDDIICEVYKVA